MEVMFNMRGFLCSFFSLIYTLHFAAAQLSPSDLNMAVSVVSGGLAQQAVTRAPSGTRSAARQRELNRKLAKSGTPDLHEVLAEHHEPLIRDSLPHAGTGSLAGLTGVEPHINPAPIPEFHGAPIPSGIIQVAQFLGATALPQGPQTTQTTTPLPGYLVGQPYPFVLPPPDIAYFGSKWNGPWGYPIGHYQAFRGTGQYITHYDYYPLSYFGSLMAPFAYGLSGKK